MQRVIYVFLGLGEAGALCIAVWWTGTLICTIEMDPDARLSPFSPSQLPTHPQAICHSEPWGVCLVFVCVCGVCVCVSVCVCGCVLGVSLMWYRGYGG